jgi:ribosomal protein S18 acetylase RimI-like enzyme
MIAHQVEPATRDFPPLDYRRVRDGATRLAFSHLVSSVFRVPLETTRNMYTADRAWETDWIAYVGYLDNRPVSTAASVTMAGAVGIYSVATLPGYRGRGIAEGIMRHALGQAREMTGIDRSVLQATSQGQSLYKRMGYRLVTQFTVYTHDS